MISRLVSRLLAFTPRLNQKLWTCWYQFLSRRHPCADWTFMNYGYAALGDEPKTVCLEPRDEPERYAIQLYHYLADQRIGRDAIVLEVGSGRGGGCSYLARYFDADEVIGIDISASAVALSTKVHRVPCLTFRQGDAACLPCASASCDVVINVESSHCYASMEDFVAEVFRVLKPGGCFLWADLYASKWLPGVPVLCRQAGFEIVKWENITPNVLRASELDSARREGLISREAPAWLRNWCRDFGGMPGTRMYEGMRSGEITYAHAVLHKPLQQR